MSLSCLICKREIINSHFAGQDVMRIRDKECIPPKTGLSIQEIYINDVGDEGNDNEDNCDGRQRLWR